MAFAQKAVALVFFGAVAEGFRVKPKKRQDKQVTSEDPVIDQQTMLSTFTEAAMEMGKSLPHSDFKVSNNAVCRLSQSDCSIGGMSGATTVYTNDANSRCLNGDGFAFLVKPGRTDKLLFYFPGGGACWKGSVSNGELCLQSLSEGLSAAGLGSGVSQDVAENGFADWTFVAPAYCDGGAYISNSTLDGKPQDGFVNTDYAVQWAKSNLNQNLANFVIAGSSAGALGTMAWSDSLLSTFRYDKAAVIVDSYMGVFPEGTQGPTIKNFGSCNLPIFSNSLKNACERETITIQDVFDFAIEQHPDAAFSMIQPKEDTVQRAFYAAIALTYGRILLLNGPGLYESSNSIKAKYDRHSNFVHYVVDGSAHTFMAADSWYKTDTGDSSKPSMVNWANGLIEHQASSECNGALKSNGGGGGLFRNTRYCFEDLFPKTLSVSR